LSAVTGSAGRISQEHDHLAPLLGASAEMLTPAHHSLDCRTFELDR
jgi:hypothetical protein